MRVALKTLGCRLNEAELEQWARQFRQRGHELAAADGPADVLVVNTCAVTREAARKSRRLIRRCRRRNPAAKLVVSGCYGTLQPRLREEIEGIDMLVHNRDKERLVERVQTELLDGATDKAATAEAHGEAGADRALFPLGRNRAFVKVQDGCRYRCAFCIVTIARGAERSRPAAEIIAQINALHEQGAQEAVLTGVHLGGYGSDINSNLATLIGRILEHTDIPRLRLGSLEPWELGDEFLRLFADPRLLPHLHLPLQSGADTVLRRMARRCHTQEFRRLLAEARRRIADLNVSTDIIAGFPGETEDEWRQTMDFARACRFSQIHIFPYSARPGARAAEMPGQVDAEEKSRRCRQLHALNATLKRDFMRSFVGRTMQVLVENDRGACAGQAVYRGYTANYLRVAIPARQSEGLINRIVPVRVEALAEAGATREPCLFGAPVTVSKTE